jgi:hypothetical protein
MRFANESDHDRSPGGERSDSGNEATIRANEGLAERFQSIDDFGVIDTRPPLGRGAPAAHDRRDGATHVGRSIHAGRYFFDARLADQERRSN